MKQRYKNITFKMCCQAVVECFKKKWRRNDVLTVIEEYAGIPRRAMKDELDAGGNVLKYEAVTAIAAEMLNRLERLNRGESNALDLDPVKFHQQMDGMSGKVREIAYECIFHQLFNHLVFLALRPLFHARILHTQYASIPNRGQTHLKDHAAKLLRKKRLGIKYAIKTDVRKAYQSTKYSTVINLIKKEIPSATEIITLLNALADMSPTGSLIIGGYLDAWLFNYFAAYMLRYATALNKERRGEKTTLCKAAMSFMDDFAFMGAREASVKSAINKMQKYAAKYGIEIKIGDETQFLTFAEEHRRRKEEQPSPRRCPCLDIGGYRVHRGYITIRRRVYKRVYRCFLRAAQEVKERGAMPLQRARSIIARYGYLKQSNGKKARDKLNADSLQRAARETISHAQKIGAKKI